MNYQIKKNMWGVISGNPGCGKSSLALSVPGRVLYLDCENSISRVPVSLLFTRDVEVVNVDRWSVLTSLSDKFIDGFDWVVLDTIGKCVDLCKEVCVGKNGTLGFQGWGKVRDFMKLFVSRFKNKNALFVAHSREVKEEKSTDGECIIHPVIVSDGSFDLCLEQDCDLVSYLYQEGDCRKLFCGNFENRGWRFNGKEHWNLPRIIDIPKDTSRFDGFEAQVWSKICAFNDEQQGIIDAALAQQNDVLSRLQSVSSETALNELLTSLNNLSPVCRRGIWSKILERGKDLNCVFDAKNKCFILENEE